MATDSKTGQPIFHGATRTGLRNVGSYQVSAHPFITGSETAGLDTNYVHMYEFPYVSKSVTVINTNTSGDFLVHFQSGSANAITESGYGGRQPWAATNDAYVGRHYITVKAGAAWTFDVKCSKIYLSNPNGGTESLQYEILAELTLIPASSMYHMTGSGVTQ